MGGACSTHGSDEKCINILVGKPEGKRQLGVPGRKQEDYIKIYHREIVWKCLEWIRVA
jgi:hypothetical protein